MEQILLETLVKILAALAVTLISVAGTWVIKKIGKRQELKNISAATSEAVNAAQLTVLELQQILVENLKAATPDGKLRPEDITHLKNLLLTKTQEKMSDATVNLLTSAGVDIEALIRGAGEALIARMKT